MAEARKHQADENRRERSALPAAGGGMLAQKSESCTN
jgi:hypothetical protein